MIILGLLLFLGITGLTVAGIWVNESTFAAPAGTIEFLGYQVHMTVGEILLSGMAAGAVAAIGLLMVVSGIGRQARRRSSSRRQMRDLQRENKATSSDLAAERATKDEPAKREKVAAGR